MNNAATQENLPDLAATNPKRRTQENIAKTLGRMIFFALLLLIALVAVPYGTVEPWWQALFECAVFGLAALWVIEGFLSGSYNLSAYRIFLPLVALILFGLLQTVPFGRDGSMPLIGTKAWHSVSADPHETRLWVSRMLALVLVGIMLVRYTSSRSRLRALILLVIGVAAASALFGLMRKTTQHEAGFFLPYLMPGLGYAQFINNNHFAFLMEMGFGLVLGLIVGRSVRNDRLPIYLALALLLAASVVLSNSRGGILSIVCQLIVVALLVPIVRPVPESSARKGGAIKWMHQLAVSLVMRALLVLLLAIIMSISIVWMGGDPLLGRLEAIPGEVNTRELNARWGERRVEIWKATWQLIKTHPVAGVGMAAYWTAIPQFHDASGEFTPQRAHNDYLELLASGGLIGVAIGVWFIVFFIRDLRKQLRSPDQFRRAASFSPLIGLFGVAVHSFVDFGLHIGINAVIFIALVVVATVDVPKR